jgi:hypothetical protein
MSASQRTAMTATFAMFGFFVAISACFAAYAEFAMVKPASLGRSSLPTPSSLALPEALPPAPAPQPIEQTGTLLARAEERAVPTTFTASVPMHGSEPMASKTPEATEPARKATAPAQSHPRAARAPEVGGIGGTAAPRIQAITKQAYRALSGGHANDAQQLAAQAVRLDPSRASAYIVLGGARDALGDRDGARSAFRDCIRYATDPLVSACKTLAR